MNSRISKGKVIYFPHDVKATSDIKIQKLMREYGMRGVGIFWYIIEYLYENDGVLEYEQVDTIAWTLHEDKDVVDRIIRNFELFETVDDSKFSNKRVLSEMEEIKRIIEDRRSKGILSGKTRKSKSGKNSEQENKTIDEKINGYAENKVVCSLSRLIPTSCIADYLRSLETSWKDSTAMDLGVKPYELDALFDEYQNELFLRRVESETETELPKHFRNLMRIRVNERKKQNSNGGKQNNKHLGQDDISTAVFAGIALHAYDKENREG